MINLYYAGYLIKGLDTTDERIEIPAGVSDVKSLRSYLSLRGEPWRLMTLPERSRVAVNHRMVRDDALISDGDIISFFPPIAGG
jgi:molybdopterin converting factor small subunit